MDATIDILKSRLEYEIARVGSADRWVPACGGNEVPFTLNGRRWLYVYNHATGKHGWLELGQDIVYDEVPA
jgi:hypothetical protein